jgi:CheY-like chemotaxis protein
VLIEDDPEIRTLIDTVLSAQGHRVVTSGDPTRAVDIVRSESPDLVICDIMMPVMDGYATMRAMRELPWRAHLPIIALTANTAPGERQRCIDAGASEYVSKPVETADLLLILGEWLPTTPSAEQVAESV